MGTPQIVASVVDREFADVPAEELEETKAETVEAFKDLLAALPDAGLDDAEVAKAALIAAYSMAHLLGVDLDARIAAAIRD